MAKTMKQATMRAQWLGQGLRRLREANGLSMDEAGDYLQRNQSTISRLETGVYPARHADVLALLDLYHVTDATQRQFLLNLSRDVVEPGWWDQYTDDLDSTLIDLAWLEARAEKISSYHQIVIPGLLQTEAYAKAMMDAVETDPALAESGLQVRTSRVKVLDRETPLRVSALIDEAALRRVVGGPSVMGDQLRHLLALGKRSTIDIRVVPFSAGAHPSPDSSFYICEMREPFAPVGYIDTLAGALYVETDTVDRFKSVFDRLRRKALSERKSVALIETAAKELE